MSKNLSTEAIQESLDQFKSEVEQYLYNQSIPFVTENFPTKDGKFVNYSFGTVLGEEDNFGLIGYDQIDKKIIFTVKHNALSDRNEKEGMDDGVYVILKNLSNFCKFLGGTKIHSSMLVGK